MAELIQYIVNGVIYGALLSLVGLGTTVIFRTTQVLNFAQGGVMATTGYTAATLVKHISADLAGYWLMVLMAAALGAAIGVVLGLLMLTAEGRASHFELSVAALGFSFIVAWIDRVIFGADPILMPHVSTLSVTIFGASLSIEGLIIIAATLTIAFLTWLVIDKSRIGLAMRAVNEDAVTARTYGISRTTVTTVSWALGCAIAGVAGVFVGSYIEVSNATSLNISIISLAALVVGGLGSSVGALVGGVALGVASSLVAGYLAPNYKNSIVFLIVLAVLVVRPQGLFGEKRVKVSESGEQRRQLPALPRPGSWTKPTPIAGAVLFLAFLVLLPHIPPGLSARHLLGRARDGGRGALYRVPAVLRGRAQSRPGSIGDDRRIHRRVPHQQVHRFAVPRRSGRRRCPSVSRRCDRRGADPAHVWSTPGHRDDRARLRGYRDRHPMARRHGRRERNQSLARRTSVPRTRRATPTFLPHSSSSLSRLSG